MWSQYYKKNPDLNLFASQEFDICLGFIILISLTQRHDLNYVPLLKVLKILVKTTTSVSNL